MTTPFPAVSDVMTSARIAADTTSTYVTVRVGDDVIAMPIAWISDVFVPQDISAVPLAARCVAGLINLRGRIVTAISLRQVLGYPEALPGTNSVAIGIERGTESFALIVDAVGGELGDVLKLPESLLEALPAHLEPARARFFSGIKRAGETLVAILDIDAVIRSTMPHVAA